MSESRETALELYRQAMAGESTISIEDTVPQFSRVRLVLSEAQMSGGDGAARPRDGHWTVEAPAALSCEMSDALDEVKSLCHKVSPVKFGGMTRDRVVIVAIGGPS